MLAHFPKVNFSLYDEIKRALKYSRGWRGYLAGRAWFSIPSTPLRRRSIAARMDWVTLRQRPNGPRPRILSSSDGGDGTQDLCGGTLGPMAFSNICFCSVCVHGLCPLVEAVTQCLP